MFFPTNLGSGADVVVGETLLQLPGQLVVVHAGVLLVVGDAEEDDEAVVAELGGLEDAADELQALVAPGLGVVGVELGVLVVEEVDFLRALLALRNLVHKGSELKKKKNLKRYYFSLGIFDAVGFRRN